LNFKGLAEKVVMNYRRGKEQPTPGKENWIDTTHS
jgi:hypothetical protein